MSEGANLSQRIKCLFSPNWALIRTQWRTFRAIDVFPIPPAPTRAIGVKISARPMISSTNSSRPKQVLGNGGGVSPCALDSNVRDYVPPESRPLTWLVSGKPSAFHSNGNGKYGFLPKRPDRPFLRRSWTPYHKFRKPLRSC